MQSISLSFEEKEGENITGALQYGNCGIGNNWVREESTIHFTSIFSCLSFQCVQENQSHRGILIWCSKFSYYDTWKVLRAWKVLIGQGRCKWPLPEKIWILLINPDYWSYQLCHQWTSTYSKDSLMPSGCWELQVNSKSEASWWNFWVKVNADLKFSMKTPLSGRNNQLKFSYLALSVSTAPLHVYWDSYFLV